ncbi:MAG: Rne/Rng family ribonuclease [Proteobacteria bacterium]|nr:Rne/Rng family ribonuclease [Pseudomonadota bacterium]
MASTLIINDRNYETRVALLENDDLVEIYVERTTDNIFVGNIYRGVVIKVLPGMQSAFIDIGMEKAAFLYVDDIHRNNEEVEFEKNPETNISSLLKEGQHILVQVAKEPIGTKGPRVTTNITLPGRYLVLAPITPSNGISRKIESHEERDRLKKIIEGFTSGKDFGLIARTASEGVSEKLLRKDCEFLLKLWSEIKRKNKKQTGKGLIHTEIEVSLRVIRDILSDHIDKIITDNEDTAKSLTKYLTQYDPKAKNLLSVYEDAEPIFEYYGIEHEIARALEKRVWLKSGGYIIIDQAEASVIIDVNTGRYVGTRNLEETIVNTNLEAAKEIAYQLRLRNLGGIIIIDFIDMEKADHKEKVLLALKDALKKDKAKTNIIGMSELGLVEMTRKRTRDSIIKNICSPCPYCEGRGYNKSYKTVAYEVFRELERDATDKEVKKIIVYMHPSVVDYIYQNEKALVDYMEKTYKKSFIFEAEKELHHEQYEISLVTY